MVIAEIPEALEKKLSEKGLGEMHLKMRGNNLTIDISKHDLDAKNTTLKFMVPEPKVTYYYSPKNIAKLQEQGGTVADKKIAVHYLEHNQLTLVGINSEKNAEWHATLINSLKEKK